MRVTWPSTAFIDETRADDSYLLAAVIIENRRHVELRYGAADLRMGGSKLHWQAEGTDRRSRIVDALLSANVTRLVVVRLRRQRESDERCRRKCIEQLLWRLDAMDVERAVFEARESSQNDQDRALIATLRSSRAGRGPRIRVDHVAGPAEPLLWWADALAGAVRASREVAGMYAQLIEAAEVIDC